MRAMDSFAPTVLEAYHSGKEEFWEAVMAPFLSSNNPFKLLKYRKIGTTLLSLFHTMDGDCKELLKEYFLSSDMDITQWKSLQAKDEYFRDTWPVYALFVLWMDEQGVAQPLANFADILHAVTYGIAGYGILDVLVDGKNFSSLELLASQTLIAEYETRILRVFGVSAANYDVLHRVRNQFLRAEIKEKSLRFKACPYRSDAPEECGYKAAHLLTPFMMSLETLGKAEHIDAYFEVFMKFGAVIQILDDLKDLEDDLIVGHYSFITLDTNAVELHMKGGNPREIAKSLKKDSERLLRILAVCKKLIAQSNEMLRVLNDPSLARIVAVTERRLDSFFKKEFKLSV